MGMDHPGRWSAHDEPPWWARPASASCPGRNPAGRGRPSWAGRWGGHRDRGIICQQAGPQAATRVHKNTNRDQVARGRTGCPGRGHVGLDLLFWSRRCPSRPPRWAAEWKGEVLSDCAGDGKGGRGGEGRPAGNCTLKLLEALPDLDATLIDLSQPMLDRADVIHRWRVARPGCRGTIRDSRPPRPPGRITRRPATGRVLERRREVRL